MKTRNTYKDGIDQDSSKLKYPQTRYLWAQSFRPITESGESTGALENIIGNTASFNLIGLTGPSGTFIGFTNIRDTTVIFATEGTGANPGGVDPDIPASPTSAGQIWTVDTTAPVPKDTMTLLAEKEFNFTVRRPIEAVGRYENEDVQKVYWTDNLNNLRFANIADPDIGALDPDRFDIVSDVEFAKPVLNTIGSGSLNVGVVQYAYRLFNNNGAETTYSPASNLVHLTRSGELLPNSSLYMGTAQLDDNGNQSNSGKSVTMTISNIDTSFDQIQIVAIHYVSLNSTPSINIVAIKPTDDTIRFTDDGVYDLGSVTLEEYRLLSPRLFTARTLETKDNILFPGNITDRFFDVDYDARAYRFNNSQDGRVYDADGLTLEYEIDGAAPLYPTGGETGSELDAFNIMNDISLDVTRTAGNTYIYQADGARLGGEGPNVSYVFDLKARLGYNDPLVIDDSSALGATGTYYVSNANTDDIDLSFQDYASPFYAGTVRGYHRSEIYRFGLVFYDVKGRVSPVKWIGDIRMPDVSNVDSEYTYYSGETASGGGWKNDFLTAFLHTNDRTCMNVLGVDFTVSNMPDEAVGYQIVRVKREPQDRTVLAQGSLFEANWHVADGLWQPNLFQLCPAPTAASQLALIYSPEISVNKNLDVGGSDYVELVATAVTGATANYVVAMSTIQNPGRGLIEKQRDYAVLGADEWSNRSYAVTDGAIVPPAFSRGTNYTINTETFCNFNYETLTACGGTVLVINQPDAGWTGAVDDRKYVVNYRRPVLGYGGVSFEDRSLNEYIACSDVLTAGSSHRVYGGDTFIGFFDCQHLTWAITEDPPTDSYWAANFTVVESSINLNLRHDNSFNRVRNDENTYLIQEEAGIHDDGTNTYAQETDLYLYNSVYSQENTSKVYLPLPSGFSEQTKRDTLIIASDAKINGELIDSWTKFRENEEIEVDTKYGPISKLINFRNHLVYFQDNGIGTVGVNQQSLLRDTGELPSLVLGSGNVLSRYDYITIDSGCQIREAICQSSQGFYWYDTVKNKFYRYSGQLKNISDIEGLFSFFNKRVHTSDDDISDLLTGTQVICVYDDKFSEAIYGFKDFRRGVISFKTVIGSERYSVTFKKDTIDDISAGDAIVVNGCLVSVINNVPYYNREELIIEAGPFYDEYDIGDEIRILFPETENNFTIVFNELLDAFVYGVPYLAEIYFSTFGGYFSVKRHLDTYDTGINLTYEHNRGERGDFYSASFPSTVEILVNPNEDTVNVYNNVELMTEVYDANDNNIADETISSVRVTNDYQDSGVIALVPDVNIKRRLRKWRFAVPRHGLSRMRDAHAKMLFSYSNDEWKRIIFHDVITHYMPREK